MCAPRLNACSPRPFRAIVAAFRSRSATRGGYWSVTLSLHATPAAPAHQSSIVVPGTIGVKPERVATGPLGVSTIAPLARVAVNTTTPSTLSVAVSRLVSRLSERTATMWGLPSLVTIPVRQAWMWPRYETTDQPGGRGRPVPTLADARKTSSSVGFGGAWSRHCQVSYSLFGSKRPAPGAINAAQRERGGLRGEDARHHRSHPTCNSRDR